MHSSMLEKGVEELLPTMLGNERGRDFLSKVVNIMRDEVGHLAVFGVPPGMINDIEFGGIGREELYVHPVPIDLSEQTGGFFVPTEAVPDDEQRALEMASQLLDKRKDIVSGDVPRRDGEIETQTLLHRRQGDGAGYREAIVSVQLAWTGVCPLGAQVRRTVGCSMKPVWSIKTIVRPSRRAFFIRGQSSLGHLAIACSSRSRARRSGFWGLHWSRRMRCHTPEEQ